MLLIRGYVMDHAMSVSQNFCLFLGARKTAFGRWQRCFSNRANSVLRRAAF
jgi:hypothetical protein